MAKRHGRTDITRDAILEAAEKVFALKGFNGARTAEIAKEARVNKALLHYYFTNKETLYHAVMDRILYDTINIAQDVLKKGLKGRKLIEGIFDAFFDYAAKHRHFARLATVDSAGPQAGYLANTLRNFFKPLFERASEFLNEESRKGKCRRVDGKHFLITMYLALLEYFSDAKFISVLLGRDATSKEVLKERKAALKEFMKLVLDI